MCPADRRLLLSVLDAEIEILVVAGSATSPARRESTYHFAASTGSGAGAERTDIEMGELVLRGDVAAIGGKLQPLESP